MLKKIAGKMKPAELDAGKIRGRELSALYGTEKGHVMGPNDDELFDAANNPVDED